MAHAERAATSRCGLHAFGEHESVAGLTVPTAEPPPCRPRPAPGLAIGALYHAPEPGAAPFGSDGDTVAAGRLLPTARWSSTGTGIRLSEPL
ncbi:hypothetical protein [Prauserella muralis]|uniref:Uncharacterized protein n=1 Tax=Prauserella muralis TaxID=588067 RepID=A0A2V4AGB2_9PSEU|nr:hypothetical protein [Prauserella muralis]PXY18972.1 hypothetical protein BAY60_29560 [Prauserella muralis]TWE28859.1 hypothetical protein FHX69_1525 [Prauserella muralis]